jgi:hypothetical protein
MKTLTIAIAVLFFVSCGSEESNSEEKETKKEEPSAATLVANEFCTCSEGKDLTGIIVCLDELTKAAKTHKDDSRFADELEEAVKKTCSETYEKIEALK